MLSIHETMRRAQVSLKPSSSRFIRGDKVRMPTGELYDVRGVSFEHGGDRMCYRLRSAKGVISPMLMSFVDRFGVPA